MRPCAKSLSRAFRRWIPVTALGLAGPGLALAATAAVIELREEPLLFADDTAIVSQTGLVRTIHPALTSPAPVIVSDRPWEGDRVYTYGSLQHDAASGRFGLWYMSRTQRPGGTQASATLRGGGMDIVGWATSSDGLRWEKPALGLHAYDGSTANNIVADFHSPAVVVDRFERDPARRFKLLGYHKGGYYASYSADGLRWHPYPQAPVFTGRSGNRGQALGFGVRRFSG